MSDVLGTCICRLGRDRMVILLGFPCFVVRYGMLSLGGIVSLVVPGVVEGFL